MKFTAQAKGVFTVTFLISTLLFILMSSRLNSEIGYIIFQISGFYVFIIGALNIVISLSELYFAFAEHNSFKIHFHSALLILLNFPIGTLYSFLFILIENKF